MLRGGGKKSKRATKEGDNKAENDNPVAEDKSTPPNNPEQSKGHDPWSPLSMPEWMTTLPMSAKLREPDNGYSRIGIADQVDDGSVHWSNGTRMNGRKIYLGSLNHIVNQSWMWAWSWMMDSVQNELVSGVDKLPKRVNELTKNIQRSTAQRIELLLQQPFVLLDVNTAISPAILGSMLLGAEFLYATFPSDKQGSADVYAILERWG
jgi:hypothetical protein